MSSPLQRTLVVLSDYVGNIYILDINRSPILYISVHHNILVHLLVSTKHQVQPRLMDCHSFSSYLS